MAIHPSFPKSPYDVLDPELRWFPADETLREQGYGQLLPPLVVTVRRGPYVAMYASSNGQPSTNHADFDWFEYS